MKIKIIIACALLSILFSKIGLSDSLSEGLGSGVHVVYNFDIWENNEVVITRLENNHGTFEFVRSSKSLFIIRNSNNDVFFKFHDSLNHHKFIKHNAKLIDIFINNEEASALLYCDFGYVLVSAIKIIPALDPGEFYMPPKDLKNANWHVNKFINPRDYYLNEDFVREIHLKIGKVKLIGPNIIGFNYLESDGELRNLDVFTFNGKSILRNGIAENNVLILDYILHEDEILKELENVDNSQDDMRASILKLVDTKQEFLDAVSNFKSADVNSKIQLRVNALFP